MTTRYKTQAFVFKKNDVNESDRSFSVFTENFGRLDIFAKAIRKNASKLRSGIDTFFLSDVEFIQGKNRKTLTDAVTVKKFNNIWQDLEKFKIANKIGEVIENFIKGEEKDGNLFNLLNETFYKLNDSGLKKERYTLLYCYFLWNALSLLGYHPEVKNCSCCHDKLIPYGVYFSNKDGGIICEKCSGKDKSAQKINSDIVKTLRIILSKDWQTLSKLKIEMSSQKLLLEVSESAINSIIL
ncbi:MAG: DNA repair protein RecO [Candidatus Staskawiczbacteria bacterium]|nr:DNA repair protein RecO [Candidatus Staskawiczbacteria bacterium]